MNPVFGHGHLRLYLLSLLAEHPRHGYELIQALSDRFGGTYSPSAGTIYPRLAKLEEEGLVTKSSDGRKTVYEITDAGRAELESRRDELNSIEDNVTDTVRMLADGVRAGVDQAMKSLRADLASAARESTTSEPRRGWFGMGGMGMGWGSGSAGANASAPAGSNAGGGAATASGADASAPSFDAAPTVAGETAGTFSSATPAPAGTGSAPAAGSPEPSPASPAEQLRQHSAAALREAEAALASFRAAVRAELRVAATKGLTDETVRSLAADLNRVHTDLRSRLRG